MSSISSMAKVPLTSLTALKSKGERFTFTTVYSATFPRFGNSAGIQALLVGGILGMVIQGHDSTLQITMGDIPYHLQSVKRGIGNSFIVAGTPFISDHSEGLTLKNGAHLLRPARMSANSRDDDGSSTRLVCSSSGASRCARAALG